MAHHRHQAPAPKQRFELSLKGGLKRVGTVHTPDPALALVCPHCGEKGRISQHPTTIKAGVSGGKATAAILTGGLSLLVPGVGLSRKQRATARHCEACGSDWTVLA